MFTASCARPVVGIDILDGGRGTGDTGIVDEHIQPAEMLSKISKNQIDLRRAGNVGDSAAHRGLLGEGLCEKFGRGVAEMDSGTLFLQGDRDRPADAGSAARHENSQAGLNHHCAFNTGFEEVLREPGQKRHKTTHDTSGTQPISASPRSNDPVASI